MAKSVIKFTRLRDVDLPKRGHRLDAGIDFFVPKFDKTFISDLVKKNPELTDNKEINCGCNLTVSPGQLTLSGGDGQSKVRFDLEDRNETFVKFDSAEGKNYFLLPPLSRINIPSGIYCQMAEEGRALIAFNKSGIAKDFGLLVGACVVDYEYQGEIHINLINTSSKVVRIYEGQKLLQFIEMPVFTSEIEEIGDLPTLYPQGATSRADGGFGSTDKKPEQLNS
jgi:dUTPase